MSDFAQVNVVDLAAPGKWSLNGGPFGSKLVSSMYVDQGVPVIRGANLPMHQRFLDKSFVYVTEAKAKELQAHTAAPGDVVITQRGTLGQVGIIPKTARYQLYVISQSQMKLTVNPAAADSAYVYYAFRAPEVIQRFVGLASTSGVPHVNLQTLRDFSIPLPPLETQRRIATILGAYDDLIEVNRRRVEVLEEMARRLFEEWFVRFRFPGHELAQSYNADEGELPNGWSRDAIGTVIERIPVKKRYSQKEALVSGRVPILDQGKVGIIGYHDGAPSVPASLDSPVIVFANHTCYQKLVHYPFSAIQNVLPFKTSIFSARCIEWLHHATNEVIALNDYKGHWPEFISKRIVVPPEALALQFSTVVRPLHAAAHIHIEANKHLAASRDLLLPRLISGELTIQTAERQLEEAA